MTDDLHSNAGNDFVLRVLSYYTRLVPPEAAEPDLGGKLLYAGEVNEEGRALVAASNIAGAASLCATAVQHAARQAFRDGIVDFVVTSLDEALRILKNEVRKHAPVAICIGALPVEIEIQMAERGVAPDILRPIDKRQGIGENSGCGRGDSALVTWSVSSGPAHWMPKLDALALECLDQQAGRSRRWVRMAPRYLGRFAHLTHLVGADRGFAARFLERAKGFEQTPLQVQVSYENGSEEFTSGHWNPGGTRIP